MSTINGRSTRKEYFSTRFKLYLSINRAESIIITRKLKYKIAPTQQKQVQTKHRSLGELSETSLF